MKRTTIIILLSALNFFASAWGAQGFEREAAITEFYTSEIDEHTCKRVAQFGKGEITEEQCRSKLISVNLECKDVIRNEVPGYIDEKSGILLMQIMMTCPFSKILNYPYAVVNGKPQIDFPK